MKRFLFLMMACALFSFSCTRKGQQPAEETLADSVIADTVATEAETDSVTVAPSKKADGLFDDFIFVFMKNKAFQKERIKFPLNVVKQGIASSIMEKDWKYDPLYSRNDTYTIIFDSERSLNDPKRTDLKHVVVEWVYLTQHKVKQYIFDKEQGQWRLTEINSHRFDKNENSDFYHFYARFVNDEEYQREHIENPFAFKTYDYDNFEDIEGLLDVEQWPDYRPDLPTEVMTNINYGQSYRSSTKRILMLCSPSGGMGCNLTFEKKDGEWLLTKLEN